MTTSLLQAIFVSSTRHDNSFRNPMEISTASMSLIDIFLLHPSSVSGSRAPHWWRLYHSDFFRHYCTLRTGHHRALCCVGSRDQTSQPSAFGRHAATRWNGRRCRTAESMQPLDSPDSWRAHLLLTRMKPEHCRLRKSRIAMECESHIRTPQTFRRESWIPMHARIENRMRLQPPAVSLQPQHWLPADRNSGDPSSALFHIAYCWTLFVNTFWLISKLLPTLF